MKEEAALPQTPTHSPFLLSSRRPAANAKAPAQQAPVTRVRGVYNGL
jgi:hypothetical protein